jgi:hypothetical protein
MLVILGYVLDFSAVMASAVAAWFWYKASNQLIHRVTPHETFDYHDLNRVIVAINRNGVRNRRGALASAVAAAIFALDLALATYVN